MHTLEQLGNVVDRLSPFDLMELFFGHCNVLMQPEPSIARSCSPGRETAKIGDVGAQMTRERSKSAEWRKVVGALSALRGDYGDDVKRAVNGLLELHHEAQLAGADGVTQMIEAAFESGDPAQMERAWALWDGLEGAEKDRLLKR